MLEKAYSPKKYEKNIEKKWEDKWVFKPKKGGNWTHINILPPPNANWALHLGHASGYSIMDIAWRYARMQGKETLLLPWKDHAWILTQTVFEKLLLDKWISRKDLGREEFYRRCYDFCISSAATMRSQEKRIWISADWDREKFTLDPVISKKTLETFVKMYDDWIAYKWNRIINWCPHCQTALSDMEVEHKEQDSKFYWIKYWPFVLATARPETKLWDTAVAVHPDDERYKDMIWKKYKIPWALWEFEVIVVWDKSVDPEFWTWAVKVTPAHSFIDFEIAQRHWIEAKMIINKEWKMMGNCWKYAWMTTKECRIEIVKDMQKMWLIEKIDENYVNKASVHDRCWNIIEPLISEQWWIDVNHTKFSLKNEAIKALKEWKIKIVPKYFDKTFFHWMENLQDWCISRQLWWGHQIPAWYCKDCWNMDVVLWVQTKCSKCSSVNIYQDPDTFDTWFSSGQWAHNTVLPFTWDEKYFPWDFMVMGRDILPPWACRMIMMSIYSTGQVPFKTLYLTGLILDKNWKKMSKSKWNWIDPLEMCDKYWTDALRLSMFIWNAPGSDMRLWEEKIENYRNFVNKLWNASRFVQMKMEEINGKWQTGWDECHCEEWNTNDEAIQCDELSNVNDKKVQLWSSENFKNLSEPDKWILSSLQRLVHEVTNCLDDYQYSNAGQKLYDFTWSEFCDWYLELSKWENQNIEVLVYVLQTLLKLLHPFIPFVTEVIYDELFWSCRSGSDPESRNKKWIDSELILDQNPVNALEWQLVAEMTWPKPIHDLIFEESTKNIDDIILTIQAVRAIRTEFWIEPGKKISARIKTSNKVIIDSANEIKRLWRIENLEIWDNIEKWQWDISKLVSSIIEVIISSEWNIDKEKEQAKTLKEIEELNKRIGTLESRLSNKSYTEKAPKHLIDQSKQELNEMKERLNKLKE